MNKNEEPESSDTGLAWLAAFIILTLIAAICALGRYYYLRYQRLRKTEYAIKEGNVNIRLKVNKKWGSQKPLSAVCVQSDPE